MRIQVVQLFDGRCAERKSAILIGWRGDPPRLDVLWLLARVPVPLPNTQLRALEQSVGQVTDEGLIARQATLNGRTNVHTGQAWVRKPGLRQDELKHRDGVAWLSFDDVTGIIQACLA
eukprot:CAMPEP_0198550850 /NCGR_PEP_ID=MMETSP1462-20131121/75621_1 /TAXON_ID=1333877 /ORGANISM="Brandtodinium nutriculum, Strain RCC3387" /LENGTH=117 /DNA_ID=CAMNT_0044281475 /DNA_START=477 /DNA_END=830 /DNA_ORIENTATION=-